VLTFNEKIARVELVHPKFADAAGVERLKKTVLHEMRGFGATRGVLRVLTDKPMDDGEFVLEGTIWTEKGELAVFGCNEASRLPSEEVLERERTYLKRVVGAERRAPPVGMEIKRLECAAKTAEELELLYAAAYSWYPKTLDTKSILHSLRDSIPYAVLEEGKIVCALFGEVCRFGEVHAVELTYSASAPSASKRGIGITIALAKKIEEEARRRFRSVAIFAETIAAPVMRSCHDFGMSHRGVLREHSRIAIGERVFTNFYLWSL